MNSLVSRKKLLIAESELNRAQLVQEWRTMTDEVRSLTSQARNISSFASAAATLIAGLASLRRKPSVPATEKPSWWRTILKGAGMADTFCSQFRSQSHDPKDK
jgi:hypothetical protein